jgi:hypothetical protein
MGPLAFFRASRRRLVKLQQLSLILGDPNTSVAALMSATKEKAEDELYDLVEQDVTLHRTITKYGVTRGDLRHIYRMLLLAGAGQWVRGHYVAASALCYGFTLEFALSKFLEEKSTAKAPKEIWLDASFRLVRYFENGKLARV